MRINGYRGTLWLIAVSLVLVLSAAAEELPPRLAHGINITNWFRFPPNRAPDALRAYLSDTDVRRIKAAGFSFIRLPVHAELATSPALADAIARLQRQRLATVVVLFAADWQLETNPADRNRLIAAWQALAQMLKRFDPQLTYPEVLNEPVFARVPTDWAELQHRVLLTIRSILPVNTVILTGADWGSIDGLLSLAPEADPNVIYSFHFYEPAELTALGAYRNGLDTNDMARLPFPVAEVPPCETIAVAVHDAPTADLMRFYCRQRWDETKVAARIALAGAWARQHHVVVIAGEFGASRRLNAAARIAWLNATRIACEQQRIGWALWGYDDSMGFGKRPPHDPSRLDDSTLRALGLGPADPGK